MNQNIYVIVINEIDKYEGHNTGMCSFGSYIGVRKGISILVKHSLSRTQLHQ